MRLLLYIDNLGAGGAQRQLVGLARMLADRSFDVSVAYYQPDSFFERDLTACGVGSFLIEQTSNKILSFISIYKFFKKTKPDVVISYLESPSMITCALRMVGLRFKLIVSERNTNVKYTFRDIIRFQLYKKADYVVPNSYSQEKFLNEHCSFLKNKIRTITNFCSFLNYEVKDKKKHNKKEISVVASIWPPKNTIKFIRAINILKDKKLNFHVSWYGKIGETPYLQECENLITELGLSEHISLLEKTKNIGEVYRNSDYFCLPSLYEGTPNVICEAICMSLPVICSDVCDNPIYVHQGENGFLFNPNDETDIASKLECAFALSQDDYIKFSNMSRKIAEKYLSESLFISKYERLINE